MKNLFGLKSRLKLMEYQAEQSARYLAEVRGVYQEIRGFKHDFHHHLQTLKGQQEAGEPLRALDYIEELDQRLLQMDALLRTGNVTLDAIFSAKLAQAQAAGVTVTVKASVPDALTLSDVELSVIFGNLLDNAIEAARTAAGERFIRVYVGMKGKMLYFSMLNAAGEKQKKQGSLFATGKTGAHGFGLKRAEALLQKHGGWCKYNSEDGAFTSEFLVPATE